MALYNVWNKPKFKWKYILILFFICSVLLVPKIIYKNIFLYMIALHFQNPHPTLPLRINQLNFCPFLLVIKSCLVELCCFNSYLPNVCFQVTWVIIFPDKSIYLWRHGLGTYISYVRWLGVVGSSKSLIIFVLPKNRFCLKNCRQIFSFSYNCFYATYTIKAVR